MIKEAVILAAGKGKRIKEGTTDSYVLSTPKPLLKIRGTPIVERTVKKLANAGVKIVMVINPEDEHLFRESLRNYPITYCYQNERKGTAHAVFSARDLVKENLFLVFMGDDISEYELTDFLNTEAPTLLGYEVPEVKELGTVILDKNGYVERVIEKQLNGKGLANTGVYILPKEFFEIYDKIKPNDGNGEIYLTDAVNLLYNRGFPLLLKKTQYWKGINRLSDLNSENVFVLADLKIRFVKKEDIQELKELLSQLSPIKIGVGPTKDEQKQMEYILSNEAIQLLIAEYHGQIVGTSTLLIQNNLSHGGKPYAHIENVVTRDGFRGLGIGKFMIEKLTQIGKNIGCYKIILNSNEDNIKFYEKCGYKSTDQIEMRIDF